MAAINEYIQQISDPALRQKIQDEVDKLTKQKKFGLVFEEHLPERTPLYELPIKKGSLVALKAGEINKVYTVISVGDDKAVCINRDEGVSVTFKLEDLVCVAEFGELIYPYLKPIDSVCNSDDIPFFLIHELRHIYQQDQIRKLKAGESIQEAPDIIKKWEFDWIHYIWNTGDRESREKNINQEVEMDANGYALALLFLEHMNDNNWSPMIRMEDDQFDLSAVRAQDYILHRPEMQKWVNEHCVL